MPPFWLANGHDADPAAEMTDRIAICGDQSAEGWAVSGSREGVKARRLATKTSAAQAG
jgi:hypothetical protein